MTRVCADCGTTIGRHAPKTNRESVCHPCRAIRRNGRSSRTRSTTPPRPSEGHCIVCGELFPIRMTRGNVPKRCEQHRDFCVRIECCDCKRQAWMNGPGMYRCYECRTKHKQWCYQNRRALILYTGPPFVRKPRPNINPIPNPIRTFKSGQCTQCGTAYVTLNLDVTCSQDCWDQRQREQKRIGKDRRRARKRDAYVADVSPKEVFERDHYKCHICRKKTDPTKQVPHPKAPTIDHLIPLVPDGTHEPSNCATAHFLCNSIKGNRGGGEQLALIG